MFFHIFFIFCSRLASPSVNRSNLDKGDAEAIQTGLPTQLPFFDSSLIHLNFVNSLGGWWRGVYWIWFTLSFYRYEMSVHAQNFCPNCIYHVISCDIDPVISLINFHISISHYSSNLFFQNCFQLFRSICTENFGSQGL